jgi:two-component system chemotaxis response regulator CheB
MIKVLIVEDSPIVRELLIHILGSEPDINIIGTAGNGEEAIKFVSVKKPDVITMDVIMPVMDGLEATRKIMETQPVPIIIVSASWKALEVEKTFHAIEAGAVAIVEKPVGVGHPNYEQIAQKLVQTVKLMSEIKVIRRWPQSRRKKTHIFSSRGTFSQISSDIKVVAIGASTGGPAVIETILSRLPDNFQAPILIVQHIASGFIHGFVDWLNESSNLPVHLAKNDEPLLCGNVYVAPDGFQMKVENNGKILLTEDETENGLCPSVSYLFHSIADVFGKSAIGVLLTGMGKDGAEELNLMKEKGAITIAQDKESSIVHGMAGEAIKLGGVKYILPPVEIANILENLVNRK